MRLITSKKIEMVDIEKYFKVEDPANLFLRYLTYRTYPIRHVDMKTTLLLGSMGSGKTTIMTYITNRMYEIYGDALNPVATNDPTYAIKQIDPGFTQLLIVDDAMTAGLDARQSMRSDNINLTQNYSRARHIAKKKMGVGILFVLFAIQDPTRLDAMIRRNVQMTFLKTTYPNLEFKLKKENEAFVDTITDEGMVFGDFGARAYALARTQGRKEFKFYFPEEKPLVIPKEIMDTKDRYAELLKMLLEFDLEETPQKILRGFMTDYADKNDLEISQVTMTKLLQKAAYFQYTGQNVKSIHKIDEFVNNEELTRVRNLRNQNKTWRQIADLLNYTHHETVYQKYRFLVP